MCRALVAFLAVSFLALFMGENALSAQGHGPPDRVPPGLHDRSIPPGPPAGITRGPPSHVGHLSDTELRELHELVPDAGFDQAETLAEAVDLFNAYARATMNAGAPEPTPELLEARALLAQRAADLGLEIPSMATMAGASGGSEAGVTLAQILLPGAANVDAAIGGSRPWGAAAIATPTGYGIDFGDVWVGASAQERARRSDGATGAAGMGFGLGNSERLVGLQVSVYSFGTLNSGFWNRGGVDLHLHRALPRGFSVAAGWESAFHWGGAKRDSGSSRYAVASQWLPLGSGGMAGERRWFTDAALSVGVGDGRFQPEEDFMAGESGLGLFGSASLRVAPALTATAEWTGQDMTLATTVAPFGSYGIDITAAVMDLTGNAGDGARFGLMGSYGVDVRR